MFSAFNTLKFPEERVLRLDRLRELKVFLLQRQLEERQGLHHGKQIPGGNYLADDINGDNVITL